MTKGERNRARKRKRRYRRAMAAAAVPPLVRLRNGLKQKDEDARAVITAVHLAGPAEHAVIEQIALALEPIKTLIARWRHLAGFR